MALFKLFLENCDTTRWDIIHDGLAVGDVPLYVMFSSSPDLETQLVRVRALVWSDVRKEIRAGTPVMVMFEEDRADPEHYPEIIFELNGRLLGEMNDKHGDGRDTLQAQTHLLIHIARDAGHQAVCEVIGIPSQCLRR